MTLPEGGSSPKRLELWSLVETACDGTATLDQRARLDSLLCEDNIARLFYVAYMHQHAQLQWETRGAEYYKSNLAINGDPADRTQAVPILGLLGNGVRWTREYFSQPVPFSMLTAAIFMVCVIALLEILPAPTYMPTHIGSNTTTSGTDSSITSGTGLRPVDKDDQFNFVARITGMHNCRWAAGGRAPLSYDHLGLGRELKLESGLLEITYYNGAKIVLEGPVEFTVEKPNACRLDLGILTAKVSQQAVGFTVKTPTAEIVDLGTEFGVEVGQSGTADVHVFVGQVDVGGKMGGGRRRLVAGQSVKIDTSGKVTKTSGSSGQFAFAAMFSDGQWARSLSYVDAVLASRPIGYWRLDESDTENAIDSSPNENHAVYSSVVEYGRESFSSTQGTAAHFDGSADGLVVGAADVPNIYNLLTNNFTVEAWVRREFTTDHIGMIVMAGTAKKDGWGFYYDARQGREGFDFVTFGIKDYRFTSFPVPEDTWTHVAVVFDRNNRASLYLDGKYKETISGEKAAMPPTDRHLLVLGGIDAYPWEGDLDEIAIYDRALTPSEIAIHYASGSTKQSQSKNH